MQKEMHRALMKFEATYPSHLATITTHMFMHMPEYIKKWGPIKGSWAMWSERMVRRVRNSAAVENRSVAALGNGYCMQKQVESPIIRERAEVSEWCRWWKVNTEGEQDANKTMTTEEKRACLNAIRLDGAMPADGGMPADYLEDLKSVFRMGEGIKLKSSKIKTTYASRRKDAVRDHKYVVTLYDNGYHPDGTAKAPKPMVAVVLKIASWQCRADAPPVYALKIKVLSSVATSSPNILSVNINSQPRGSPTTGEWVGIRQSVARRQPMMLPKIMNATKHNVILSSHLFDVCLVPED